MEIDPLIRQITIDLITGAQNPIIDLFNVIWVELCNIEADVYHYDGGEVIYYMILDGEKEAIFYLDIDNNDFWCDYEHYWSLFESKFKFQYYNIVGITKILMDNALKCSVPTPYSERNCNMTLITDALK